MPLIVSGKRRDFASTLGGIFTPQFKPSHLLGEINFFAAFGFNDPDGAVGGLDQKIRGIVGEIAVGLDVIELEADGEIVFGKGLHVGSGFEKGGEAEFEAAGMGLANDFIEDGFFGGEIGAMLGAEGARLA